MKKVVYVILWIFLGLILSFVFHAIIEIFYLKWTQNSDIIVNWVLGGACALPVWLIILLPILGIVFGLFCGLFFWQKIYAERVKRIGP